MFYIVIIINIAKIYLYSFYITLFIILINYISESFMEKNS